MTHEIAMMYQWTINSHFDIRLFGAIVVPGGGVKDIAKAQSLEACGGRECKGEDPAMRASLRFRARF